MISNGKTEKLMSDAKRRFAFDGELGDVLERHFLDDVKNARLSQTFKLYYQLRPWIPRRIRQALQEYRNASLRIEQDWFLPSSFIQEFESAVRTDVAADPTRTIVHPWPNGFPFAFCLTHDVETEDGLALVDQVAQLEEALGFRSSWNFVPYKYSVDPGLLRDLKDRGHEIGVHGYNHDGKLFQSEAVFRQRAKQLNVVLGELQSNGFRAPMVHRNLDWISELNVDYDASCFDVDPFQAMPGGVGGMWPFFHGDLVELPYTLPQDHTLFVSLGETNISIWQRKLEYLRRWSGMAMLITHPDYLDSKQRLSMYEQLLQHCLDSVEAWVALPHEVAAWWREREEWSSGATVSNPSYQHRVVTLRNLFPQCCP